MPGFIVRLCSLACPTGLHGQVNPLASSETTVLKTRFGPGDAGDPLSHSIAFDRTWTEIRNNLGTIGPKSGPKSAKCEGVKARRANKIEIHDWSAKPPFVGSNPTRASRFFVVLMCRDAEINESFQIEPFLKNCSSMGTSAVSLPKNLALNSLLINHLEG